MEIVNSVELLRFGMRHARARSSLDSWIKATTQATWKSFKDVRQVFRSADIVKDLVIFDIGGNNYRLIASIDYNDQRIHILEIMTHSEYDRWQP